MSDHINVSYEHSPSEFGTRAEVRFEGVLTEDEVKTAISDFIERKETGSLMSQHPLYQAANTVQRDLEWIYDGQMKLAKVNLKVTTEPRFQMPEATPREAGDEVIRTVVEDIRRNGKVAQAIKQIVG
ncbi:hypothetical protein [Achromobacter sp. ACM05]|uniref:hypothetical protein n=1 Tax=Achromobacter sp. ACM05 TaxID=2854776 RepID=UPI001C47131C|nr:hypothetical protein [Achromobacter sp. ACM05]MBV7502086.1 hypothetical protein [Achromobacter sp. ACM05]